MTKLEWCKKQSKGIRVIEPNINVANSYLEKADEALKVMISSPSKEWKIITGYYACYNCLYALLQKIGIKCEIHSCSIALMRFFDFEKRDIEFMENLKEKRINVQYYNRKEDLVEDNKIKDFMLKCKEILHKGNLEEIRTKIKKEKPI